MPRITELDVNGSKRRVDADADRTLLSVLRDDLDLTGTKYGCGEGPVRRLHGPARRSADPRVPDKGRGGGGQAHRHHRGPGGGRQTAPDAGSFIAADAMQCGWCTPGMILGAVGLLRKNPHPSEAEIVTGMNGHICRCGTYPKVVAAIQAAAKKGGRA